MLVKLYELPSLEGAVSVCEQSGVVIRRALAPDKKRVTDWITEHSTDSAASEADVCFSHTPVSCFIATKGAEIVGYACYNAICPDFFGPTHVKEELRHTGIGKALLLRTLHALHQEGYAYAIIGGVGPAEFYSKTVGATLIPDSAPGIYKDFLLYLKKEESGSTPVG